MFKYDVFVVADKRAKRARVMALTKGETPRNTVYQYITTVDARDADDAIAVAFMAMYNIQLATKEVHL